MTLLRWLPELLVFLPGLMPRWGGPAVPQEMKWTTPGGYYNWPIPQYTTLEIDVVGPGGGGAVWGYGGGAQHDAGGSQFRVAATPNIIMAAAGGMGATTNSVPPYEPGPMPCGTASGGQQNIPCGGAAGGQLGPGGPGGRAMSTFTRGAAGAPAPGANAQVYVGRGGTGAWDIGNGPGENGQNGWVIARWL